MTQPISVAGDDGAALDAHVSALVAQQAACVASLFSVADELAGLYASHPVLATAYIDEFVREGRSDVSSGATGDDAGCDGENNGLPSDVPARVLCVRDGCHVLGLRHALRRVPSDYYDWALERRRDALSAPSVRHLCKTIVMENTYSTATDCSDPTNSRYYCVIVQYTTRLNAEDVLRFVRGLKNPQLPKKRFNFRLCDPAVALALTGFENGAVSPIGMTTKVPIILSAEVLRLQPRMIWLGGGHMDWKLGVSVDEFVAATACFVGSVVFAGVEGTD